MKRAASLIVALIAMCPAMSWAQSPAEAAFARQDFATAQRLWQGDAEAGDPQAMLGLGLLLDRGYGGARDPAAAFDWYLQAADLGLAEAQFNIAVMYDAGLGQSRSPEEALLWYSRAALRGHARAQYNLGLLYDSTGSDMYNPDLAQHWFQQAATVLPAAKEKINQSNTPDTDKSYPRILFADWNAGREVVWTTSGPADNFFLEEVPLPHNGIGFAPSTMSDPLTGSGLLLPDETVSGPIGVRVLTLSDDATSYAASDWTNGGPKGRITLIADPSSAAMMAAAEVFAQDLQTEGYWTNISTRVGQSEGYVTYGFEQDMDLAEVIMAYLPKPAHDVTNILKGSALRPGEIRVDLTALRATD